MSYISFHYEQNSYDGMVIEVRDNYYLVSSKLERLYVYEKGHDKEVGDYLHIEGNKKELSFSIIESGFDFEDYLNKKGVEYQFEVKTEKTLFRNPLRFKAYQDRFLSHFSDDTRGIVGSILCGRNEEYNSKDNLDSLHLNRLINASGLYYAAYLSFFTFLFSFFFKKKYAKFLGLVLFFPYLLSLIYKFSILRFFVFAVFRYINEYILKKKVSFISYYSVIGIVFLIIDYHFVYTDSFILGFSIPLVVQLVSHSFSINGVIKKKVVVYTAILLFFIPFDIKYHHEIFLLTYPLQVILSPLFTLFGVMGIISYYGLPIYPVLELFGKGIYYISSFMVKAKLAIYLPSMNEYVTLIYYAFLFVTAYYISIHYKLIYKYLILFTSVFTLTYISPIKNGITDQVTFINVGQGDACLITHQYHSIMIDTGGSIYTDIANDCLIPYLKSRRIYNIDLLITTHDDFDHMGAASTLMENFTVKEYVKDASKFPLVSGGIELINYNTYFTTDSEDNDKSLVIGFHLGQDYLIMGDAPIKIEKEIIANNSHVPCDILKVGHHGSNTSTCDEFVKFLSPKEAIISVGKNNYGHPSQKVINILNENNVKIRSTKQEGSITYTSYSFCL